MQSQARITTYILSADGRSQVAVDLTDRQHRRVYRVLGWQARPHQGAAIVSTDDADAWIEAERVKVFAKWAADKAALALMVAGRMTEAAYARRIGVEGAATYPASVREGVAA